jgi:hypothetical protein
MKRPFEIFDIMNVADETNKTGLLATSPYLVEAKTAKGGGHVVMGVPAEVIMQLMNGDRKALLLIFDKKEYDRIDNESKANTHAQP